MASTSFDRDAARRAWRQVARTRGGGQVIGDRPLARSWPLWLGATVIVGWAAWAWLPPGTSKPAVPAPTTVTSAVAAGDADRETPAPLASRAPSSAMVAAASGSAEVSGSSPSVEPTPGDPTSAPPETAAAAATGRTLRPRLAQPLDRADVPEGTARPNAEEYRALRRARGDGEPLGGIGAEALHVDHLAVGSHVRDGLCGGENGRFSVGRQDAVHVCIRLVHRRIAQQILVRWERDGRLVRRQWLAVPGTHAYRTRASLPVKRDFAGRWTVRVVSLDGIELGKAQFEIEIPTPKARKSRKSR